MVLRYLVSCIWFPLIELKHPGKSALPLTVGGVTAPLRKGNRALAVLLIRPWSAPGCILYPDDSIFNGHKRPALLPVPKRPLKSLRSNRSKGFDVKCSGDDIIEELHQRPASMHLKMRKSTFFGFIIDICVTDTGPFWAWNSD